MNKYKIFIQDKLYKTIEDKSTGYALTYASKAIKDGKVTFFDNTKPSNIRIENVN